MTAVRRHPVRSAAVAAAGWWIVGSNGKLAGIPRPGLLLIIFAVPFFVLPFTAETLLRLHDD